MTTRNSLNGVAEFQLHLTIVKNTVRHLRNEMQSLNSKMGSIIAIHEKTDSRISAWGSVLNNTEVYGEANFYKEQLEQQL